MNEKVSPAFLVHWIAGLIGDHYDTEVEIFKKIFNLTFKDFFIFRVGMSKDYPDTPLLTELDWALKKVGYTDGELYLLEIKDL